MSAGSDDCESDWAQEFQCLRARYLGRLQSQLAMLDELLREARQGTTPERSLEAAYHLAHRLKGTSGTYGLQESFAALETIEEQLGLLLGAVPDAAAAWGRIEKALERATTGLVTPQESAR